MAQEQERGQGRGQGQGWAASLGGQQAEAAPRPSNRTDILLRGWWSTGPMIHSCQY